jgi:hypothetical protein
MSEPIVFISYSHDMLLQSLFEDERVENGLFVDTRIVRVTEAILFLVRLYGHLGAVPEARLSLRIGHRGLKGRTIAVASHNRHIFPAETSEDRSEAQLSDTVVGLRERLVDHVMQLVEPMFMLFDFKRFERSVYEDIVTSFAAGRIT